MGLSSWLQLTLFVGLLLLLTRPLGAYLYKVLETKDRTIFSPSWAPAKNCCSRPWAGKPKKNRTGNSTGRLSPASAWPACCLTYLILRLQHILPLNPQHLAALDPSLAFNTAASFASNTNWQNYAGESTMSHFSQMAGLTFQNFVSSAAGIAVAAALVRGIARKSARTIGNFWSDLIRVTLHLLLPLSFLLALFFIQQGTIQNFQPDVKACLPGKTLRPGTDPVHPPGTRGLAGGDQDAGYERRRLFQRQFRPPLRKPDSPGQLPPDAGHFPDPSPP